MGRGEGGTLRVVCLPILQHHLITSNVIQYVLRHDVNECVGVAEQSCLPPCDLYLVHVLAHPFSSPSILSLSLETLTRNSLSILSFLLAPLFCPSAFFIPVKVAMDLKEVTRLASSFM